ncbi:MAG TPA: hypothetical protein VNP20_01845 [Nocardioidaceae bacterium]|nr:hypothetical protein [Nocardioidaceae bacterium]
MDSISEHEDLALRMIAQATSDPLATRSGQYLDDLAATAPNPPLLAALLAVHAAGSVRR